MSLIKKILYGLGLVRLHVFAKKYGKTNNIMKYSYILKYLVSSLIFYNTKCSVAISSVQWFSAQETFIVINVKNINVKFVFVFYS